MFDPEKADRFTVLQKGLPVRVVPESEYDYLLELYRKALAGREAYAKGLMTMRQPV